MVNLILVVSLVFALIVAIFAVQNNIPVNISFLGWKYTEISLVLIIIGSAVAGAVTVFCLGLLNQFRLKREIRHLRVQNGKLSSRIKELEDNLAKKVPAEEPDNNADSTENK